MKLKFICCLFCVFSFALFAQPCDYSYPGKKKIAASNKSNKDEVSSVTLSDPLIFFSQE